MAIKIKVQKDYYVTEVSIDLPSNPGELDELLKAIKTTGKAVVQYNQGSVQGINVEQRTRIPDALAIDIRQMLGIGVRTL